MLENNLKDEIFFIKNERKCTWNAYKNAFFQKTVSTSFPYL